MNRLLFWIFFALIAGTASIKILLEILNRRWTERHKDEAPEEIRGSVDPEKAAKIAAYTQAKCRLRLYGRIAGQALLLGLLLADGFAWLSGAADRTAGHPLLAALLFFGSISLASWLLSLPFDWTLTFRVEERFGFNRTSYRLWIADLMKALLLSALIGGALLALVAALLYYAGPAWWLICWGAVFLFSLVLSWLYPKAIAPLFNKFVPLEEGELRNRAVELMERAGLSIRGVFIMDAGKRSSHTNAYFTGLGRWKRIVFYDTLLDRHETGESLSVLAHEAGHWKKRHLLKSMAAGQALSLGLFALTGWLVQWAPLYEAFGFERIVPYAGLFLASLVYGPIMFLVGPLLSALSRKQEYEADAFAARELGLGEELARMLVRSALDNLSNLNPHPWYVRFYYSHPPLAQRVRRLRALKNG